MAAHLVLYNARTIIIPRKVIEKIDGKLIKQHNIYGAWIEARSYYCNY
jgi:hypothetical protein